MHMMKRHCGPWTMIVEEGVFSVWVCAAGWATGNNICVYWGEKLTFDDLGSILGHCCSTNRSHFSVSTYIARDSIQGSLKIHWVERSILWQSCQLALSEAWFKKCWQHRFTESTLPVYRRTLAKVNGVHKCITSSADTNPRFTASTSLVMSLPGETTRVFSLVLWVTTGQHY